MVSTGERCPSWLCLHADGLPPEEGTFYFSMLLALFFLANRLKAKSLVEVLVNKYCENKYFLLVVAILLRLFVLSGCEVMHQIFWLNNGLGG